MSVVGLDPHILAVPIDATQLAVETFAEAIVDWAGLLKFDAPRLTLSATSPDALIASNRYPYYATLRTILTEARVDVTDPNTLFSATQRLLRLATLEELTRVDSVQWTDVAEVVCPQPAWDGALTESLLSAALLLLLWTADEGGRAVLGLIGAAPVGSEADFCFTNVEVLKRDGTVDNVGLVQGDLAVVRSADELFSARGNNIASGCDLWEQRDQLFPSLGFSPQIATYIEALGAGDELLNQVVKKLKILDYVASEWQAGSFPRDRLPFKVTGESEATMNQYGGQRDFLCADGSTRRFQAHARLTPKEWRLYFLEEKIDGRLPVGYIGPHLSIAG